MSRIFLTIGLLLLSVLVLAGCAAPSTSTSANGNLAGNTPPAPPAPPPMSSPLPPREIKQAAALDTTCKTRADCAVKDVGSCCGTKPACVNKDSPTDPAAVQAQCKAKGMMGICGFREIPACQCDNGQCVEAGPANPEPSSDPAEPVR